MLSFFRNIRSPRGQSTIEFALALPIFVLVFFAIVEFSHLFYVKLTLRQALRQAGRYMVTGQGQDLNNTNARIEAIKTRFCQNLIGTGLPCPTDFGSRFTLNPPNGGNPGQPVTITATFTKPWFTILFNQFSGGGITFTVSTTWVNYGFVTV